MRDYEVLYIVRADLDDEKVQDAVKRVNTLIERSGGSVERTNLWGKRKLAYRIDKYREGTYVLFQFTGPADIVREFERRLRVSDQVLKFLTVRIDENLKRLEKRKKARDKRAAKRAANAPASPAPAQPSMAQMMTEAPGGPMPGQPKGEA